MKTLDAKYIDILEQKYGRYWWPVEYPQETVADPFKHLIVTVLSQNTSEANCIRAYKGLAAEFAVRPDVLAKANTRRIRNAIKGGGLYNIKARRIKTLCVAILQKYRGDISSVLTLERDEARQKLMELPGVGRKTADVLLAQRHSYAVVTVVDTHMHRIAERLGLVAKKAGYDAIQKELNAFIPWDRGERAAGLLWLLAKYTCKSRKPDCGECPIIEACDFGSKKKSRS